MFKGAPGGHFGEEVQIPFIRVNPGWQTQSVLPVFGIKLFEQNMQSPFWIIAFPTQTHILLTIIRFGLLHLH